MRRRSRKKNICHVVAKLDVGGMENGVVNLLNNHDRSRFELMLCCLNEPGPMAARLKPDVKLLCMEIPEGKRQLLYLPKLTRAFLRAGLDVVHTHGWASGSLYGVLSARLAGVPVVVNGEHGGFKTGRNQIILQRILAWLCDRTLSVGKELKNEVVRRLGVPARQVCVIPNGVDMAVFSGRYKIDKLELLRQGNAVPPNGAKPFLIGCVGSIKPSKNQIMILKALNKLRAGVPDCPVYVVLVGDGPDRPMIEAFVRDSRLGNNVLFLGIRHDVPRLLSAMDLFVSLSLPNRDIASSVLTEGLSNVLLEAMSSGVPVIATDSIGASELLLDGVNGFVVKAHDIDMLCDRIKTLLHNSDILKKFSGNAKAFIRENYSLQKMVASYESLYLECLGDRMRGSFSLQKA